MKLRQLDRNDDGAENQKQFERARRQQDAVRNKSERCFAGQTGVGARQRRTNRSDELVPWRGPLHEQPRRIVMLGDFFELERGTHGSGTLPSFSRLISILSPISVPV